MTKEREALKLALGVLERLQADFPCKSGADRIAIIKDVLAQPEQDTCKGCNGNGVVGNILDTDTCPFCKGSGVEAQPEQEPVVKPYAYEYGRDNGDGTYTVAIKKGDLEQIKPAVYDYVRPKNAHKDWPIKELFDRPQTKREWVGLNWGDLPEEWVGDHKFFAGATWAAKMLEKKNK